MALADKASGLKAEANLFPPGPPKLRVTGSMKTSNSNDRVTLHPIPPSDEQPAVQRFRVEIAPEGKIGTPSTPATGLAVIEYSGPYDNRYTAVELIFSDASKALIDNIEIIQ